MDDNFMDMLGATEEVAKAGLLGGGNTSKVVDNILDVGAKNNGVISGKQIQSWRTTLQTAATKAYKSDSATKEYADALDGLLNGIDDLIERNLSADDLTAWQGARKQWTAIKQLEKSKAINEVGNVSGRKLANSLTSQDVQGYARGANTSDLYDAARLSKAYPPMGDSGTAGRLSIPMMMATPPSYLMGANAGARAYANPESASKLVSGIARGATGSELTTEERQREIARQLRNRYR